MKHQSFLDKVGITLGSLCAIHCALTPLIVGVVLVGTPLTVVFESIEPYILGITLFVAGSVLSRSALRIHKTYLPLIWFCVGFISIIGGHYFHEHRVGIILSVAGASMIVYAHRVNLRACRTSSCVCSTTHHS